MPSSANSMTSTRNDHSFAEQARKSKKGKPLKEVFLHQPAPSPPVEDWTLFPEDVVIDKHSSHKGSRPRKVKEYTRKERSNMTSLAPDDKMEKAIANAQQYIQLRNQTKEVNRSCSHRPTKASPDVGFRKVDSRPRIIQAPNRIPTPDLSDIEEDDLWSCCATSESSIRTRRDYS